MRSSNSLFMKKLLAFLLVFTFLFQSLSFEVLAVETNNSATPWTWEKAEHLARRALFRVTPETVQALYDAGSAEAAVDIIFTEPSIQEKTQFLQELSAFMQGKSVSNDADMEDLYLFDLYRDPFDAKRKIFTLLEDIFSVAVTPDKQITHANIRGWHQKIYNEALGNYKDLIYQSIYDYAPTKYLDLLNGNPNSPNENFARELLQLFLMEEYLPLDSDRKGARNYSEADVQSLAIVLTGFTSTDNVSVVYNAAQHNSKAVDFLGSTYQSNAQDPARVVDYIFQKKGNNIAQFVVWRFYKFFISESPTQAELDTFVKVFQDNDYEILPMVKAMLTSKEMYSSTSMNELRYKNPLELSIGTQVLLRQSNLAPVDAFISQSPRTLGFLPYRPNSIFGRGGMDKNAEWFNSFVHNQWMQLAPKFVFQSGPNWKITDHIPTGTVNEFMSQTTVVPADIETPLVPAVAPELLPENSEVLPENTESVEPTEGAAEVKILDFLELFEMKQAPAPEMEMSNSFSVLPKEESSWISLFIPQTFAAIEDITPLDLIKNLEQRFYISRRLSDSVRTEMVNFLTTRNGVAIPFEPANSDYQNSKIKSLVALMMLQPEYLLQSGFDQNLSVTNASAGSGKYGDKGSLVILSFGGGADWLQFMAPTSNATYKTFRGNLALSDTEATELEAGKGLKMNNSMSALFPYYNSGELRIINSVGVPNHSRSHSEAREQMESGLLADYGAIAKGFAQDTTGGVNLVSLYSGVPRIFQGTTSIAIGASSASLTAPSSLSSTDGADFLAEIKAISKQRMYPGDVGMKVRDALTLDTIAKTAGSPGGSNTTQFEYVKTLITNNIGKVYYMNINGGYDTHGSQKAGMNSNLKNIADRMTAFYEEMKAIDEKVTLVTFSEFGRTNKVNGSAGTDHGNAGGMMVLSNEGAKLRIPSMAGNIDLATEPNNWLQTKIDVRAAWNTFMEDIFGIDITQTFPLNPNTNKVYSMVDYTAEAAPNIVNIQEKFQGSENVTVQFSVQDAEGDFKPTGGSSKVAMFAGSSEDSITNEVLVTASGDTFQANLTIIPGSTYYYKIVVNDENFNTRTITRSLQSPRPVGASGSLVNGMTTPVILDVPQNVSSNPIQLSVGTVKLQDPSDPRVQVTLLPRTQITGISAANNATWSGQFSPPSFIPQNTSDMYLGNYVKGKLHVGPSDSSVQLQLNQSFMVQTPLQNPIYYVDVFHSYDDQTYTKIQDNVLVSDAKTIEFSANSFGYFLFVDHPNNPPEFIPVVDNSSNSSSSSSSSGSSGSSSSGSNSSGSSSGGSSNSSGSSSNGNTGGSSNSGNSSSSGSSSSGSSSNNSSTTNSGGGSSSGSASSTYTASFTSQKSVTLQAKNVSLEKTSGKIPNGVVMQNQQFTLYLPEKTTISDAKTQYSALLQKPKRLKAQEQPFAKFLPGVVGYIFSAGTASKDLVASKEFTLAVDISELKVDWETQTVALYYFDYANGVYKLVKDGGFIAPDKASLQVNTKYLNTWGVFIIQK